MSLTLSPVAGELVAARTLPYAPLDDLLVQALGRIRRAEPTNIGFPRATDLSYREVLPFLDHMINNLGHPRSGSIYPAHAKEVEGRVLAYFARLVGAAAGWDGYLTSGGTEGNLAALAVARTAYPDALVYLSTSAHYSVAIACDLLGLPYVLVLTASTGEMDYADLRRHASDNSDRPGIVVCTIGTTMTEAVDDVPRARRVLADAGVNHVWIHADAALAGPHLALSGRTDFRLGTSTGSDTLSISGHKWYGTPVPCGVVLHRRPPQNPGRVVDYIGALDSTITGSRAGLVAVMLWHALSQIARRGPDEHRLRAERARALAGYAVARLAEIGWPCWRNPDAITVMLQPLPAELRQRWPLPSEGGWAHLICMPGTRVATIDTLVQDLREHS